MKYTGTAATTVITN